MGNPFSSFHRKSRTIVQLLVEFGTLVNIGDHEGITPIFEAVAIGNVDIFRYLIENGAKLNVKNVYNESPIDWIHNLQQDKFLLCLSQLGLDV